MLLDDIGRMVLVGWSIDNHPNFDVNEADMAADDTGSVVEEASDKVHCNNGVVVEEKIYEVLDDKISTS